MKPKRRNSIFYPIIAGAFVVFACGLIYWTFYSEPAPPKPLTQMRTVFGMNRELGEPFGIAEKDGEIFISDGENGKILRFTDPSTPVVVTDKLKTPSDIEFDKSGDIIVADTGSHTIKRVNIANGAVETIAGTEDQPGFADGAASNAKFNGPVGIAVAENGKIFVADTYNDRIRVIENGQVSTLAGSSQGFGEGENAKFNTPLGIALAPDGNLLVADAGNFRIRIISPGGKVGTLAGNGAADTADGLLASSGFVRPTDVCVSKDGTIYVADGNSIRALGRTIVPLVETLTGERSGFSDGPLSDAKLNRPSGIAVSAYGEVFVADSENRVVRVLTREESSTGKTISQDEIAKLRLTAEEFRALGEPRWTYDPPEKVREIAGTLGEIRGEITEKDARAWFHNGLDIVGGFGERARFIRSETVLDPFAVQNFATLRELIRLPNLGYIHIKLGRNSNEEIFNDPRFIYSVNEKGELTGLRVARGTKFIAGEAIGTLNAMNHVHLVAGRRGNEFNALDALTLPGVSDSRVPTIESVAFFDENWNEIETEDDPRRINLAGKTRIVVKAFDQMDGNADRRRLGVFWLGFQVLDNERRPLGEVSRSIDFSKLPPDEAVPFVYAKGSRSGATGETTFNYIVTNKVLGDFFQEGFFNASELAKGEYLLRIFAADYFGNVAEKDVEISIR